MTKGTGTQSRANGRTRLRIAPKRTLLGEIDERIKTLEGLLGQSATKEDIVESEKRIIAHMDAVMRRAAGEPA